MKTTRSKSITSLKAGEEIQHDLLEFGIGCLRDFAISPEKKRLVTKIHERVHKLQSKKVHCCRAVCRLLNSCQQVLVLAQYVLQEGLLKLGDLAGLQFVQVSPHTSINDRYLLFNGHRS